MEINKSQYEQTACGNGWSVLVRGTYFMFLRPYRIMLLLECKQSKNFAKVSESPIL